MGKKSTGKYPAYEEYLGITPDGVIHAEPPRRLKVILTKTLVWAVALGLITLFAFISLHDKAPYLLKLILPGMVVFALLEIIWGEEWHAP